MLKPLPFFNRAPMQIVTGTLITGRDACLGEQKIIYECILYLITIYAISTMHDRPSPEVVVPHSSKMLPFAEKLEYQAK